MKMDLVGKITDQEVVSIFSTFANDLIVFKDSVVDKNLNSEDDKATFSKGLKYVGKLRRDIEAERKKVNAPALQFTKLVNGHVKELSVEVSNIEKIIKEKLSDYANLQRKAMEEKLEADKIAAEKIQADLEKIRLKKEKENQELDKIEAEKKKAIEDKIEAEKAAEKARMEAEKAKLETEKQEECFFVLDKKTLEAEDRLKELEAEREHQERMAKEKAMQLAMEEERRVEAANRERERIEKAKRDAEIELAEQKYVYKTDWDIIDFKLLPDNVFEERVEQIKKAIAPTINTMIKAGMENIPGIKINITKTLKI